MLPQTEADYIRTLNEEPLFSRGPRPKCNTVLPTIIEYNKLHRKVTQPYDFELTNIYKLSKYLTKNYDFMHLSNIFDYVIENDYEELFLSLMKFVNTGGKIVMESFEEDTSFNLNVIGPKIIAMSGNKFVLKKAHHMHIFERIR
jgi:hypothetical protein